MSGNVCVHVRACLCVHLCESVRVREPERVCRCALCVNGCECGRVFLSVCAQVYTCAYMYLRECMYEHVCVRGCVSVRVMRRGEYMCVREREIVMYEPGSRFLCKTLLEDMPGAFREGGDTRGTLSGRPGPGPGYSGQPRGSAHTHSGKSSELSSPRAQSWRGTLGARVKGQP